MGFQELSREFRELEFQERSRDQLIIFDGCKRHFANHVTSGLLGYVILHLGHLS